MDVHFHMTAGDCLEVARRKLRAAGRDDGHVSLVDELTGKAVPLDMSIYMSRYSGVRCVCAVRRARACARTWRAGACLCMMHHVLQGMPSMSSAILFVIVCERRETKRTVS